MASYKKTIFFIIFVFSLFACNKKKKKRSSSAPKQEECTQDEANRELASVFGLMSVEDMVKPEEADKNDHFFVKNVAVSSFCGVIDALIPVLNSAQEEDETSEKFPTEALVRVCDQAGNCLPDKEEAWNISYNNQFWSRTLHGLTGFLGASKLEQGNLTLACYCL